MRKIHVQNITKAVKNAVMNANFELNDDVIAALKSAKKKEVSALGRDILMKLVENADVARKEKIPLCQDTGLVVMFVEIGQDVVLLEGNLYPALEEGVRQGYREGFLRKSVCHPFTRKNTGDNTPVIIHLNMVPGNALRIWVVPKGGGSENMSRLFMLSPSAGWKGAKEKIVQAVIDAGPNPCPPTILGVGIGGNFEQCAIMAKKALLRTLGTSNPDPEIDAMEQELLDAVNKTGIGPQGLGGSTTSLAVHILMMPCHIASLPVALNIQCHSSRHVRIDL